MSYSPTWQDLTSLEDLEKIIEDSRMKPMLILKVSPDQDQHVEIKEKMEREWTIADDQLNCFLVDSTKNPKLGAEISDVAGIGDNVPQVLLFADGVAMYDESQEMINAKKIKLALKIINRTFRWMETRV
ncbi:MAG: monothiol bacilliredoxin BrxC family protein [Bacteroidota bacterium]